MLSTYLTSLPLTKFVLIEDSLQSRGSSIVDSVIKKHQKHFPIHYLIFEGNFQKSKRDDCVCYDYVTENTSDFESVLEKLQENCIIVISSLAHLIYKNGITAAYSILSNLKAKSNVHQILTLLHVDLLLQKEHITRLFGHLATLHLELDTNRISYTYKKSIRKIIKQIEEFSFNENGDLLTSPIAKPIQPIISVGTNPETLSTFKIGLSDKDKESRENLVLPYLPTEGDSNIHYTLDEEDDWDEEDPDDDLDI